MANSEDELKALRAAVAELTARIYRLEQKTGLEAPPQPQAATPPTFPKTIKPPLVSPPPAPTFAPLPRSSPVVAMSRHTTGELESTIGKLWLNRIGILAILVGVSYFIKYAFDNGWIGPSGKITLGLIAGIGLVLWSERFRSKGYAAFSYSLKAVGIGTLYLSLWGAYQVYHLVPSAAAFVAMIIVTGSTIALALSQNAEILAAFAMIGGFSTPILLSSGENHEVALFAYVALLDAAILAMVAFKPWRRLLVGSFIGTVTLYVGWYSEYYTRDQRGLTVLFTLIFGAIFAVIPLVTPLTNSRWLKGFSITLTLLPLFNAAMLFLALFAMYESEKTTLTFYSLALAAVYLVLSSLFKRRVAGDKDISSYRQPAAHRDRNCIHHYRYSAEAGFALDHHRLVDRICGAALVAVRAKTDFLRYFAGATLALGIIRLVAFDNFRVETLIFNARFATYLVAIAILGGIVAVAERRATGREIMVVRIAGICLNVLALMALTLEASDYFNRQLTVWYQIQSPHAYIKSHEIEVARNFSYSAIWLVYGAGLMMFGFWKQSAFVRWQALVLIALTIGKVFLFDVSELQQGYRILSFIALGAVLMGISYAYHRDWLKLSRRAPENSEETSA